MKISKSKLVCLIIIITSNVSIGQNIPNEILKTLGVLGYSTLYLSYSNLGLIADAHGKLTYSKDMCKLLIEEQKRFTKTAGGLFLLLKINKVLTEKSDIDLIITFAAISLQIDQQAEFLIKYINTGAKVDLINYEKARQTVLKSFNELGNIFKTN